MGQQPLADEPCPCGSEQPFDSCCIDRYGSEFFAWLRVRQAEYHLVPRIIEYERRTWGLHLRDEAIRLFYASRTSSESEYSGAPAFKRWFPFTWVPDLRHELKYEDRRISKSWPTASLGVTWLASASSTVSGFEQTFILTAAGSPHSRPRRTTRPGRRPSRPAAIATTHCGSCRRRITPCWKRRLAITRK
jgi:hypothetical protein